MNGSQLIPIAKKLDARALLAERERSPKLAEAYDAAVASNTELTTANGALTEANGALTEANGALVEAAGALLTALSADEATIAGCATEIAALQALMPAPAEDEGGGDATT